MQFDVGITQVYAGPSTAGGILAPRIDTGFGVPTAFTGTREEAGIYGCMTSAAVTGLHGYRFEATMDMSSRRCLQFSMAYNNFNKTAVETFENGGVRIVFEDSSGNWSAYNVYGSQFDPWSANPGNWQGWTGYGFGDDFGSQWVLEKSRTPDAASGTLNWAAIVAVEFHLRTLAGQSTNCNVIVGRLQTVDRFTVTQDNSNWDASGFLWEARYVLGWAPGGAYWPVNWWVRHQPYFAVASKVRQVVVTVGFQIGNGADQTVFNGSDDNYSIVFWPLPEDHRVSGAGDPGFYVVNSTQLWAGDRLITFNQSPTDNIEITNWIISGTRLWALEVIGSSSGTLILNGSSFAGYSYCSLGHGTFDGCTWFDGDGPVQITAASTITRGTIRATRATRSALRVMGGPGTYSNIDVRLDNASAVADIVVGNGGAGTYALPNIEVPAGYTLKVRNESARNAVVVQVPAGLTTSTSTAGGSITVESAAVEYTLTLTGLLADSEVRLYRDSDDVELAGVESSGTTWSYIYAYGGSAVAATLVIFKESRAPIRLPLSLGAGSTTLPIQQQLDRVFLNPA